MPCHPPHSSSDANIWLAGFSAYIDSGSSGYPQAPAGVHYSQHPQDRQEALYHPVADQPRTARSDSTHGIAAYQQPEMSSPLSTGLTFANQHPPGFTYRGHSPASSVKSSPPARMAAFPHQSPVIDPMAHMHPHHRHNSVSSVSSSYEVASNWSPASPAAQHSRQNSLYSLPAQLDSVALGGTPQPESSLQVLPSGQQYVQTSPHVQHHLRYVSQADARRFSLDERSIRVQPQAKGQQAQGRHWPWGGATSGSGAPVHTRHGSMSGAPLHDYSHSNLFSSQSGGQPHVYSDAAQLQQPLSPTRFRSMSSSAISGRHVYGHPGQSAAASAAAAMGLGIGSQAGPSSVTLDGEAGSAPGPARRAKFKRSRTGCLVCRRRKVKCSQDGTPCRQCRIGKRDCHYEENPPKRKRRSRAQSNASEGALAKAAQHAQRLSSGDTSPSTSAHGMGALSR